MGLPAAKHFDPVVGIDIHFEIVPPVTPIPNPFVGFLFDPFDYIPLLGATVWVNGVPRAQAGTAGLCMPPHRPMVGPFVKDPEDECELFMGSMTVAVDGDAFGYLALPVLSCNDVGIAAPPRMKNPPVRSMVLPTSIVIAIPMGPPVFVGGPPTVSLMTLGMRFAMFGLGKAFGALKRMKLAKQAKAKASATMDAAKAKATKGLRRRSPSTNKGCGRPGEPVDVVSGANVDEFVDFERPGAAPLRWTRYYDSRLAGRPSLVGRGFRLDLQRELQRTLHGFTYVDGEGEPVDLPPLRHDDDAVSHDGLRLRKLHGGVDGTRDGEVYELEGPDGVMRFAPQVGEQPSPVVELRTAATTWRLHYDEHERPVRVEDATRQLGLRYDPQGRLSEVIDDAEPEAAPLASYRHDARGRLVEHRDAHGHAATYAYDDADRMTRKTDRNGYAFHYRYDDEGRCVHSWGDDGMYEIRLAYDGPGRETTVTWPDGGVWRYRHDEQGVLTEIVDPDGWSQRFVTDEHGRVVRQLDEAGNATTLLYDHDGRHTGRRDPLGYPAPPIDEGPKLPDPLGYALPTTPRSWRWGGLLGRRGPGAPAPRRRHDRAGWVFEAHDAHGVERWRHDASGNVVAHRDRDGRVTRLRHGSWNQPRAIVGAEDGVTTIDTDFRENVTRIEDPGGAVHEYAYDRKGRLVEARRDGATLERYRWDRSDNLVEKLDGRGRTLLWLEAGPGNLLTERRLASGEVQRFEHDARGRIVRASLGTSTIERAYDGRGRVVRDVRDGQGVEHQLRGGRLVATRWLGRFEARYEHGVDGAVTITDPIGGRHRLAAGEDGSIMVELGNGTTQTLRYDDRGSCVRSEVARGHERTRPWVREHRYSGHGDLLLTCDSEHGTTAYRYDGVHRLVEARCDGGPPACHRWDAAGNLLEQPGLWGVVLGAGNRLRAAGDERFAYDERLRLCRRERPEGSTDYHYDSLDRLVAVVRGNERWSASYDPLCRRVSKTWRGRTTTYHWDDFRLAAECFSSGTLRIYVYPDLDSLVPLMFVEYPSMAAEPSMGRAFFVLTDQVGAPLRVEDEQGHEVWRARMQPFGRVEVEAGSAIELSLRFPGHLHDPETGLHHNRFRYYDPRLGRYLQPDPMGVMGGLNVYQYCPSPSSTVDLDGLMEAGTHAHHGGAPPLVHGRDHLSWGAWARSWGTWAQSYVDRARGFASRMRRTRSQLDELLETPTIGQSVDLVPGTDTVKRPLYIRRSRGTTSRGEPYDDVALTTYDPTELYPAELYPDATIRSQVVLFTPMRPTDGIERGTPLHRFDGPGAEGVTAWATPGQTGCSVLIVQWPDGKYSMAHLQPPSDDAAQEWALHHRGLEIDIDDDVQRGAIKDAMLREELQALVAASQAGGGPPERHILVQTMSREMAEGGGIQVLGLPDAGGGWAFSYKHVDDESTTILEWSDGGP